MGRGVHHELTGVLLANGLLPMLRVDDGGEWRLDISGRYRHLLGKRVRVTGKRSDFDMINVEKIDLAFP
ncbi:DUF5818 domain-containing protein [Sphingobium sp. YR768]|uniref:DUF5818 domain-containing protein n=1 Tax=Sphingobium sp. YR768 TaxID=1884365 RepID=UPI0008B7262F|nr:DUF5818 domain-containing protein [Sphingobium sp. YR768]SES13518.1 hypothetical protein SAMN05518866_14310 [Sphingobium sp. YR768]